MLRLAGWFGLGFSVIALIGGIGNAAEFPAFREQVIDPHCGEICYAVTLADVDGDKRQDIVAVTENRVLWYQAPDWKKRVIIEDQTTRDNVCIAAYDIDGDGQIDFALGGGLDESRHDSMAFAGQVAG